MPPRGLERYAHTEGGPEHIDEYRGANRRSEAWHLKKEINLAHLFTTISACVAVAIFIANQDKRIALLESSMVHQERASIEFKAEIKSDLHEIKEDIKQLVRKLK